MLGLISAKKYAVQKILILARYSGKREIHSRNRKATELIAKGGMHSRKLTGWSITLNMMRPASTLYFV
ncbi:unnamed protein product [Rhodiola kirilowii]